MLRLTGMILQWWRQWISNLMSKVGLGGECLHVEARKSGAPREQQNQAQDFISVLFPCVPEEETLFICPS